jgi:hypothetical protein
LACVFQEIFEICQIQKGGLSAHAQRSD